MFAGSASMFTDKSNFTNSNDSCCRVDGQRIGQRIVLPLEITVSIDLLVLVLLIYFVVDDDDDGGRHRATSFNDNGNRCVV
jgi:hypothetical protein